MKQNTEQLKKIEELLGFLDDLNVGNKISYSVYSELHDKISELPHLISSDEIKREAVEEFLTWCDRQQAIFLQQGTYERRLTGLETEEEKIAKRWDALQTVTVEPKSIRVLYKRYLSTQSKEGEE